MPAWLLYPFATVGAVVVLGVTSTVAWCVACALAGWWSGRRRAHHPYPVPAVPDAPPTGDLPPMPVGYDLDAELRSILGGRP